MKLGSVLPPPFGGGFTDFDRIHTEDFSTGAQIKSVAAANFAIAPTGIHFTVDARFVNENADSGDSGWQIADGRTQTADGRRRERG